MLIAFHVISMKITDLIQIFFPRLMENNIHVVHKYSPPGNLPVCLISMCGILYGDGLAGARDL